MNNQKIKNHPRLSVKMATRQKKIPPHVTGKLSTNIFSLTMYTQRGYKQKYRGFVKLFSTAMIKPMNAYHPRLYVNYSTSCKNPVSCQISTSTFSYKPTYKINPAKNSHYTPLRYYVSVKTYVQHSFAQENHLSLFFITKQAQNHQIFYYPVQTYHHPTRWLENPSKASQKIVGGTLLLI